MFCCGRVNLIQWCLRLTDSAGSQTARLSERLPAHCHLMEIAADCVSQIHYYSYILLSFLVCGISTFSKRISGCLRGNTDYSGNKATKHASHWTHFSPVPSYCVAHKEDVQWKAASPWDFLWLIYNDGTHYKQPMLIHWLFAEWPLCVMNAPS